MTRVYTQQSKSNLLDREDCRMSDKKIVILGAGLAGTIMYSVLNKKATIIERSNPNTNSHHAVLHFRNPELGRVLDLEFKKINVQKSIVYQGKHYSESNIFFSNQYSLKLLDTIEERSIDDLKEKERWITVGDQAYNHIIDPSNSGGVYFNSTVIRLGDKEVIISYANNHEDIPIPADIIISTLPLAVNLHLVGESLEGTKTFSYSKIYVYTIEFEEGFSQVYQTIYYPATHYPVYRASLEANKLIIEAKDKCEDKILGEVLENFGLNKYNIDYDIDLKRTEQTYGKITPLAPEKRRSILNNLTQEHNMYCIGRFALWKNVRMDDIYQDALKIKEMIRCSEDSRKYFMRKGTE